MTARMTAATVSSEMQRSVVSAAIKSNLSNTVLILAGLRPGVLFAFGRGNSFSEAFVFKGVMLRRLCNAVFYTGERPDRQAAPWGTQKRHS
jgi:hypothetical protein